MTTLEDLVARIEKCEAEISEIKATTMFQVAEIRKEIHNLRKEFHKEITDLRVRLGVAGLVGSGVGALLARLLGLG